MKDVRQGKAAALSNLERLQAHLKKHSLAEKLVVACVAAGDGDPRPSLRKVIFDRVQELKRVHESVPNQKA
jgi:hypothetical protein